MFEERRLETARELLARGCAELVRRDAPLEPALQLIEAALLISPMLRSCAVRRGREGGREGGGRGDMSTGRRTEDERPGARASSCIARGVCLIVSKYARVRSLLAVRFVHRP